MDKMEKSDRIRQLATEFLLDFDPAALKQIDLYFDKLKFEESSKLEVNFGLALPPHMRRKILQDIGVTELNAPVVSERFFPYLVLLEKVTQKIDLDNSAVSKDEIANLIREESRNLKLFDYEIQKLLDTLPHWFESVSKKRVVQFNPSQICRFNEQSKDSSSDVQVDFKGIIGKSEKMHSVFDCLKRISSSNLSILIQGESGTGKELVAHAVHTMSDRSSGNFIPVNCGALPDSIIESELFGYEKGAFTGAAATKKGYFEIADGGTLFLDEITETSLHTQVKLLRALQEKSFFRVGGIKPIKVDTRIIAATNQDTSELIKSSGFRHDLYYRINEMTINLPPLRERLEDLRELCCHFLEKFAVENSLEVPKVSDEAFDTMLSYRWPGNIRELENALKRALVMSDGVIMPAHLPQNIVSSSKSEPKYCPGKSLREMLEEAEMKIISEALCNNGYNITRTAQKLLVTRRTLQRKMSQYAMVRPEGLSRR